MALKKDDRINLAGGVLPATKVAGTIGKAPPVTTQPVKPVVSTQSVSQPARTAAPQATPAAATQAATQAAPVATPAAPAATQASMTQTTQRGGISEATRQAMQRTYTPSQQVQDAYARLQEIASGKPGPYQSQWQDTIDQLYGQMQGRDPFSYDATKDPLYMQYRALYTQQGRNAMMDTMGQAAGLTGGYGSTYSQNAGQQAYDSYLQQLNQVVPELAQQAYNRYKDEGDELLRRYELARENENQDYGRYRDTVGDWENERSDARSAYDAAYSRDYTQYGDEMQRLYQLAQMENNDYWQQVQLDYQKERDKVADAQWERQFAASQRRGSGGGGGGSSSGGSGGDEAAVSNFGSGIDPRGMSALVGDIGLTYKQKGAAAAQKKLDSYTDSLAGKLSEEQFYTLLAYAEGRRK